MSGLNLPTEGVIEQNSWEKDSPASPDPSPISSPRATMTSDSLSPDPSPTMTAKLDCEKMEEDKQPPPAGDIPPGAFAALTEIHKANYDFVKALLEGASARSTCGPSTKGGAVADSSLARELCAELEQLKKARKEMAEELKMTRTEREKAMSLTKKAKETVGELKSVLEGFQTLRNSFFVNTEAVDGVLEHHRQDAGRILTAVAHLQNSMHDRHAEAMTKMKELMEQDRQLNGSGRTGVQNIEEGEVPDNALMNIYEREADALIRHVREDAGQLTVKRERTPSAAPLCRFPVSPDPGPSNKREKSVRRSSERNVSPRRRSHSGKTYLWCPFCHSKDHQPVDCWKVSYLSERRRLMRKMNRCFACLKNHRGDCKSHENCMFCKRSSHHSSLCESSRHIDHLNSLQKWTCAK